MTDSVMLVEDEKKTAEMLKQALESEGIEISWFQDGTSALTSFTKGKYDLVVLDLKLPNMSGDEILEKIREADPYVDVVVYTNYQDPPVMQKLINLGVEGYISKGADADLWDTVEKIKSILDPFTDEERDELLEELPPEAFRNLKF